MNSATALIVVDHGSRREAANTMLEAIADLLRRRPSTPDTTGGDAYVTVEPAHMELAEPSIKTAVDRCVAAGATQIVVALLFLSPGRHSTQDIPDLVAAAIADHPGIDAIVGKPLGPDERIIDLLLARAVEANAGSVVDPAG